MSARATGESACADPKAYAAIRALLAGTGSTLTGLLKSIAEARRP